jgi:signal transduction histidine kinase
MGTESSSRRLSPLGVVRSPADEITRLKKLYELSMTLSGDPVEIFEHVARMIGELLDVKVVCLSEVRGNELFFLSVYARGKIFRDAGRCPISITPCATVEQSKDFRVYEHVADQFPEAGFLKEHNAFSYCGFPALDNEGNVVAVTCLLDDRPHEFSEQDHEMLRIFGQRIGMEIERRKNIQDKDAALRQLREHQEELEKLVAQRTQELETANSELKAFSYSVSHDLRAPLRSIQGFSDILLEEHQQELSATAREHLQRITGATQRMSSLIDGLLALSRISDTEITLTSVDLSELARNIANKLRENNPERNVQFVIEAGIRIEGDQTLVESLLDNLMGNAHKYTKNAKAARIHVGSEMRNRERVYFVADNGVGFNMAYHEKLFEPFGRLHGSDAFPGSGIGLATAQRIVTRHGGKLWATGKEGEGATFYFTLG